MNTESLIIAAFLAFMLGLALGFIIGFFIERHKRKADARLIVTEQKFANDHGPGIDVTGIDIDHPKNR